MAVKNIKESEFDEAVSKGKVLVDFWATWCGPCKMQGALIEEKLIPEHPEIEVVKVDVSGIELDQALTVADLKLPEGTKVDEDGQLIVFHVRKPHTKNVEAAPAEAAPADADAAPADAAAKK